MILTSNAIYVQPEIALERLTLCRQCEFNNGFKLKHMKCEQCGCKVGLKIRYADSKCPIDKWKSID